MKHLTVTLAAGLVLAAGLIDAQPPPANLGPDAAIVVQDSNTFALDLYGRLARRTATCFSQPYSISNALAMTYAGAGGETATQMARDHAFASSEAETTTDEPLSKPILGLVSARSARPCFVQMLRE